MNHSPYPPEEGECLRVPEDSDAERILLSTICNFADHPEIAEISACIHADQFIVPAHREIYRSFLRLWSGREDINPISIKADLEAHGVLTKVNGYVGLIETINGEEVRHPIKLAERLRDLWTRRQVQVLAAKASFQAGDTSIPVHDLLREIQTLEAFQSGSRLTVTTADEFLDQPIPDQHWLIPGLIPLGVPSVLASKGGIGKSFLSLQMCIALATGKPFLAYEPLFPMGSVYFGLEDSKETFHRRVRSIVDHYKACCDWTEDDDLNLRKNLVTPWVNWRLPGATAYLPSVTPDLSRILDGLNARGVPPGVVIIDTLARVSEGDENTVQALRPILNSCHTICSLGYTPLLLHHVGKGQDGSKNPQAKKPPLSDRMSTDWVRGSSAIVDNFRCVLQFALINEDEADGASLDVERARLGGYLVFGATKLNGGQKADWIFLEQDDHGRWFAPQDGVETLAKIRGRKALTALSKQIELLADLYQATRWGGEPNRDEIAKRHAPPDSKDVGGWWRQSISRLRKSGFIQPKNYHLTPLGIQRVTVVTNAGVSDE